MKGIKKTICLLLSLMMILSMGAPAFAFDNATGEAQANTTTSEASPFSIEISTDKSSYSATGIAKITAKVTNTSGKDIKNVSAEAVFGELAPCKKNSSKTTAEAETLKDGESLEFTYSATINKNAKKLNIFEKIILWIVRLFNGGYFAKDNGFDNGRESVESYNDIKFGKRWTRNTVKVWYGESGESTEGLTVNQKIDLVNQVEKEIENISNSYKYVNATTEEKSALLKGLLQKLENNGKITNLSQDGNTFMFNYKNGWSRIIDVEKNQKGYYSYNSISTSEFEKDEESSERLVSSYNYKEKSSYSSKCIFSVGSQEEQGFVIDLYNQYKNSEIKPEIIYSATVETYANLGGNDFIYIQSHGKKYKNQSWICTQERDSEFKLANYETYLDRHDIGIFSFDNPNERVFCISSSFFENNYKHNELDGAIIYIGACEIFGDNNIVNYDFYKSFRNAGASTVIGYCNSIIVGYSNAFMEKLFSSLIQGATVGDSFDNAVSVLGKNHNELLKVAEKNEEITPGFPVIFGEKNIRLLKNAMDGFGIYTATVKDKSTKKPINNVIVYMEKNNILHFERTDENGEFTVKIPKGKYQCYLYHENYTSEPRTIEIKENGVHVDLTPYYMLRCSQISGNIIDKATKRPVFNALIDFKSTTSEFTKAVKTDSNGSFMFKLPYGAYSVSFDHDDYEWRGKSLSVDADEIDMGTIELERINRSIIASGLCGANGSNVKWELDSNGTLAISGKGEMWDYYNFQEPWCKYNQQIKTLVIENGVTSMDLCAFDKFNNLKSIIISESVIKICNKISYRDFPNLTNINVSSGNTIYHSEKNCVIETASKTLVLGCNTSVIPSTGCVTSIGSRAFSGCKSLTSITIPNSVTEIGWYAFSNCTSLENMTIPNSVTEIDSYAFSDCTSLKSIAIPNSVIRIGWGCFVDCTSLTSITIPNNVSSIYEDTFAGCTDLTSITIPDGVTKIGSRAFADCTSLMSIVVPDSVISVYSNAFFNTAWYNSQPSGAVYIGKVYYTNKGPIYSNQSIIIKDGTKGIADATFRDQSLTGVTVTIPESVINIGSYAFYNCSCLTEITIPVNVTSIGDYAFADCTRLKRINWNATSVTNFDSHNHVFSNAGTVNSGIVVNFGNSVKNIPAYLFYSNSSFPRQYVCPKIKEITINNGVSDIGIAAFKSTKLTNITIPSSVTNIGYSAFSGCVDLTNITISDGVTKIDNGAFSACTGLTSVTIPDSVTEIGYSAFNDCKKLSSITINNPNCSIYDDVRTINDTATIYGYKNSTAQAYAEKYHRTFIPLD